MNKFLLINILFFLILQQSSFAQKKQVSDLYVKYENIKKIAYEDSLDKAIDESNLLLGKYPNFHDMRIVLARIYAWQRKFMKAREEIKYVLEKDNSNTDAFLVLVDIEIWDSNLNKALSLCDLYLSQITTDIQMLLKKVKVLQQLNRDKDVFRLLDEILKIDPSCVEAKKRLKEYNKEHKNAKLNFQYDYEYFNEPYLRRWHINSIQYEKRYSFGKLIGKMNVGDLQKKEESILSNNINYQFEIESYPVLSAKKYMFVNYAYSAGELFPKHRFGVELYQNLPYNYWFSLGTRFLQFENTETKNIYIYTGSLEKYFFNYWFAIRAFVSPKNRKFSQTYTMKIRKYLKNSQNYIGIELDTGIDPDKTIGNNVVPKHHKFNKWAFRLNYQNRLLSDYLYYFLSVGFAQEEYAIGDYRNTLNVSVRLSYQL